MENRNSLYANIRRKISGTNLTRSRHLKQRQETNRYIVKVVDRHAPNPLLRDTLSATTRHYSISQRAPPLHLPLSLDATVERSIEDRSRQSTYSGEYDRKQIDPNQGQIVAILLYINPGAGTVGLPG